MSPLIAGAAAGLAFVVGLFVGWLGGGRAAVMNMRWRVRAHFYAKGCSHKAVDAQTHAILTEPGLPDWRSYRHIRDRRKAEGLEP